MTLEEPEKVSRKISSMAPKQREEYINIQASKAEDFDTSHVQEFTDANKLFYSDFHALLVGKTRQGKTTLLTTMLKRFLDKDRETTILHRDDGGLEFLYLARYYPTRVFIPNDENIELIPVGFKCDIVRFDNPQEIIKKVWQYDYPFNVIVYDVYSLNAATKAKFYSELFMRLLFHVQQMRKNAKKPVIFSIDELNDLVPPKGKGNPEMALTRSDVEQNIRKLGKHKVRLIGSAHRFNQIGLDTRSQFEQVYIKKCYGYDAWDFFTKNLATSNKSTFWKVLKHVLKMPRNEFLLFDENQQYDFYKFPDIPRPDPNKIDIEAIGSLPLKTKEEKNETMFRTRFLKATAELSKLGLSDAEICRRLEISPTNYNQIKNRNIQHTA